MRSRKSILFSPPPPGSGDAITSGIGRYSRELLTDWGVPFTFRFEPYPDQAGSAASATQSSAPVERGAECLARTRSSNLKLAAGYIKAIIRAYRYYRRIAQNVDLIHLNRIGCETDVIGARLATRLPIVATVHNLPGCDALANNPVRRVIEWFSLRSAHQLIAVSKQTRDDWVRRVRISAKRFSVVYNGMTPPVNVPSRQAARQQWGIPDDVFCIGICARLHRMKGHEVLFNALHALKKTVDRRLQTADFLVGSGVRGEQGEIGNQKSEIETGGQKSGTKNEYNLQPSTFNLHLLVAGEGPLEAALKAQVERLGLGDCVRFVGFLQDPFSFLAALDLQVLPSIELECMPYSIIEGMHVGLPSIVSDVGGAKEVIGASGGGSVVPAGDVSALASAMSAYINDPDRCGNEGQMARQYARTHLTAKAMQEATLAVYRKVLSP